MDWSRIRPPPGDAKQGTDDARRTIRTTMVSKRKKLGEILVARGVIDANALADAL